MMLRKWIVELFVVVFLFGIVSAVPSNIVSQSPADGQTILGSSSEKFSLIYNEEDLQKVVIYWNETWPFACSTLGGLCSGGMTLSGDCVSGIGKTCSFYLDLSKYHDGDKIVYYFGVFKTDGSSVYLMNSNGKPYTVTIKRGTDNFCYYEDERGWAKWNIDNIEEFPNIQENEGFFYPCNELSIKLTFTGSFGITRNSDLDEAKKKSWYSDGQAKSFSCSDSDNGIDYYKKGVVSWTMGNRKGIYQDDCFHDNPTLAEMDCKSNRVDFELFTCPNGCKDEACVSNEQCVESWNCGSWSDCTNNQQIRSCTDSNNCGSIGSRPILNKTCNPNQNEDNGDDNNEINDSDTGNNDNNLQDNSSQVNDCGGCVWENELNCYSIGVRKSGNYCSEDNKFVIQLNSDSICENNFECNSNLCLSGKCVNPGLIERILNWFKALFGVN